MDFSSNDHSAVANSDFHWPEIHSMPHGSRIFNHGSAATRPGRVSIHLRNNEISHLIELVQSTPDIREEKVALIQHEVENDTYSAIAEQIVDKIISGNLIDRV